MQSNNSIKILFVGDIFGRPGREAVKNFLPKLKVELGPDLVFANGENLAGGKGITFEKYQEMCSAGVDYFTSGNHVWNNRDIIPYLKEGKVKILRPANYYNDAPGRGKVVIEYEGTKITLVNLQGQVFLSRLVHNPFVIAKEIVDESNDSIVIIDFHAEATSEKVALAHFLDGKVVAVLGTHTHVQTADARILPQGSFFISDIGMCGALDSVIGMKKELVIKEFLTGFPQSHKVATEGALFNAVFMEINIGSKKVIQFKSINIQQRTN
ncbi:MAG TPA: TIGR00282 family metallophosphoesterase [bacterium]|nr:TIGR00282 family metallophosphoesterase [bacterium]